MRSYPASYTRTTDRGASVDVPGFLLPFGRRHSLLGSSCARHGIPRSLRSAYQTAHARLDHDGVVTFHMSKIRPGWASSVPRGRWCAPG